MFKQLRRWFYQLIAFLFAAAEPVTLSDMSRFVIPSLGKAFTRDADGIYYQDGIDRTLQKLQMIHIPASAINARALTLAAFDDAEEAAILEDWFRGTARTFVPSHIGLFTTTPADDGTGGVEVTGGSYARQAFARNATNWSAATLGAPTFLSNLLAIVFPTATANWGTVVAWGYFDALTVGNLAYFGVMTTAKAINNTDDSNIPIGALVCKLGDDGDTF